MSKFKIGDEVVICKDGRDSDPYWVGKFGTVCDISPVKNGAIYKMADTNEADTWDVQVDVEGLFEDMLESAPWFDETELRAI